MLVFDFTDRLYIGTPRPAAPLPVLLAAKSSYALRSTLQAVDAAAEAMVPTGGAWNDADSLMTALRDPESRAVARRYLEARGR